MSSLQAMQIGKEMVYSVVHTCLDACWCLKNSGGIDTDKIHNATSSNVLSKGLESVRS